MIIDDHLHVTQSCTTTRKNGSTYATPPRLIEMMDEQGIDAGILLPSVNPECADRFVTVEDVLEICAVYPGRFIPFCNLDPRMDTNSASADMTRFLSYYKDAGCKGVGEICANLPFDDPLVDNMFAHCAACEMPVIFHVGPKVGGCYGLYDEPGLPRLEAMLQKHPELILVGHSQPFWAEISGDLEPGERNGYPKAPVAPGGRLTELFERYPNLYGDMSAGSGHNAVSRDAEFGYGFMDQFQDRLFFGTDICSPTDKRLLLPYLRDALDQGHISQTVFDKLTFGNANRVMKLGFRG